MTVEPIPYSVTEGLKPLYEMGDLQTGYFKSERRCPECGRCLNTNGTGKFQCPECGYCDKKDVSKLYAAGLDYNFHEHNKGIVRLFGSRRF